MLRIVSFFFFSMRRMCVTLTCCEILSSLGLVQDPLKSVEKRLLLITKGFTSGPVWTDGQVLQKWMKVLRKPNSTKYDIDVLLLLHSPSLLGGKSKVKFPVVHSWTSSCFCSIRLSHRSVEHPGRIRVWSEAVLHVNSALLIWVGGFVWKL